jgi:hypothetical protein
VFTLMKFNKRASSRLQLNLKEVRDGIVVLPHNQYRCVLEVSSVNFKLKSEGEQDALIDTFASFLDSLPCAVQIIVRIRELDMSDYIKEINEKISHEPEQIYKDQLENYVTFVSELVDANKILSRSFYIVIPCSTTNDFALAKEQLSVNAEIITQGLMRLGVSAQQLDSLGVLDLFHNSYNPRMARQHPMSKRVEQLLSKTYVKGVQK